MTFRSVCRYLIPIYIVWFIAHIALFLYMTFNLSLQGQQNTVFPGYFIWIVLQHFLLILIAIAFWIWMLVDAALRDFTGNGKVLWVLVVALTGGIGSIVYYYMHGKQPLN